MHVQRTYVRSFPSLAYQSIYVLVRALAQSGTRSTLVPRQFRLLSQNTKKQAHVHVYIHIRMQIGSVLGIFVYTLPPIDNDYSSLHVYVGEWGMMSKPPCGGPGQRL